MPVSFKYYESTYPSWPQINSDDKSGCTPLFISLDSPLIVTIISNLNSSHAQLPFTFFLLQHIATNHQQFFSEKPLQQAALDYAHYCDSLMLIIALNAQSPLLTKNLNWTVWFPITESVTHVTWRTQIWTWFQHWWGLLCLYYTSNRQQHSIDLLYRVSHLTCTTATHSPEIPWPPKHLSAQLSKDSWHCSSTWQWFCLYFNDKLLYKK